MPNLEKPSNQSVTITCDSNKVTNIVNILSYIYLFFSILFISVFFCSLLEGRGGLFVN